jgi:FkbM family methyltransferase
MNFQPRAESLEPAPLLQIRRCRHGPMLFFPHDWYIGGALLRYGEYSEIECRFLLDLIDDRHLVVEVGANIGTHTVPLAKRAREVWAFEPQRIIFQMLCANISMNRLRNVHALPIALGKQHGIAHVPSVDYDAIGNFGRVALGENGEPVEMMALDDFRLEPRLIKIDVEGMECEVLLGAQGTIERSRPLLYVENDRPERAAELLRILRGLKYEMWWHLAPLFNPDNFYRNPGNAYPQIVAINMICAPIENSMIVDSPKVTNEKPPGA